MRDELVEEYQRLKEAHKQAKAASSELLSAIKEFNLYINVQCSAADEIKQIAKRIERNARDHSVLRDDLEEWKNQMKEKK